MEVQTSAGRRPDSEQIAVVAPVDTSVREMRDPKALAASRAAFGEAIPGDRRVPSVSDWVFALALTAIALLVQYAVAQLLDGPFGDRAIDGWAVLLLFGTTLPLAFRRTQPLPVLAVVGVCAVGYAFIGYPQTPIVFGVLAASFSVASYCERRESVIAAALVMAIVAGLVVPAALTRDSGDRVTFAIIVALGNVIVFGTAWILGDNMRTRRAYLQSLETRAQRLEREREERAREAVRLERARMARELHDVIAHHVGVMLVQTSGARAVLAKDPATASEAMRTVERTGREVMAEMRHLLGVLRQSDDTMDESVPLPGVAMIGELVEQAADAGIRATYRVRGPAHPLPTGLDLSVYRIVQEALTNVMKHAPGALTEVTVEFADDQLEVSIVDDGAGRPARVGAGTPQAGHGYGLVGMAERVATFDGDLRAGPLADGGFAVVATLPAATATATAAAAVTDTSDTAATADTAEPHHRETR